MPQKILEMLAEHEYLRRALQNYGAEMRPTDVARLKNQCDEQILKLLNHCSEDPRVTLVQVRFAVRSLTELAKDPLVAKYLSDVCLKAIARLEQRVGALTPVAPPRLTQRFARRRPLKPAPSPASHDYALLDTLSDRVVVMDRDYRYLFCNRANAAFHGRQPNEMIGQPVWSFIGENCFASLTKPKLDECFSGQSFTLYARHTYRAPTITTSVLFQPIRDGSGSIASAIVSARDVTALRIPDAQVWRVPSLR